MAKITFPGLSRYERQLQKLGMEGDRITGQAIYAGASVVADEIRQNIRTLPENTGVTKRGLEEGFGIAPLRDDNGFRNVKAGFDGYNEAGRPNQLMARIMESGTSKVQKHPFIAPAVRKSRKKAEETMERVLNEEIEKIMK